MGRSLVVGLVLVAALAGCGGSAGTARDQALLASVMSGMKTDLASVQLAPGLTSPAYRPNGLTLVIQSDASTTAAKVIDDWYGRIIARAYNAQCEAKADHCLTSFEKNFVGRRYPPQPFAPRKSVAEKIRAAFAEIGLHVVSLSFERPYALAPIVTVRTFHPQQALFALYKAEMPGWRVAGGLVEMLDGQGRVFDVEASDPIEGTGWVAPGFKLPGQMSGPTGVSGPTGP